MQKIQKIPAPTLPQCTVIAVRLPIDIVEKIDGHAKARLQPRAVVARQMIIDGLHKFEVAA